jgi:hypothetical protein
LIFSCNLRQKRVVKNYRRSESDVRDDEQQTTEQVQIALDKEQQAVGGDGDVTEQRHQSFFEIRVVTKRAQNWEEKHLSAH